MQQKLLCEISPDIITMATF